MKYFFTIVYLLYSVCGCKKEQPHKELNVEKLILQQNFEEQSKFQGVNLKFKPESYEFELGSEGFYWFNSGRYSVEGRRIMFKPTVCQDGSFRNAHKVACDQTFNDGFCELTDAIPDAEYTHHLRCVSESLKKIPVYGEINFPIKGTERNSGEILEIDGKKVIVLGRLPGLVLEAANLRDKPAIQAPKQTYFPNDEKGGEFLPSVPRGTKIVVLAKTVDKDRVQKWENYWYQIIVGHNDRAWIFGEFVKVGAP